LRITLVVVLQLPQINHGEDAEASAQSCLIVLEWTKRNADAGIEVAKVRLPELLWKSGLASECDFFVQFWRTREGPDQFAHAVGNAE